MGWQRLIHKKSRKNHKSLIGKLWISGNCSSAIIIPKPLAEQFQLVEPCYVNFSANTENDGIILRKIVQT